VQSNMTAACRPNRQGKGITPRQAQSCRCTSARDPAQCRNLRNVPVVARPVPAARSHEAASTGPRRSGGPAVGA
jgi:hypothetical protein